MKAPHRISLQAVGIAAGLFALLPSVATAQRANTCPGPETKQVLVTTFRGDPAAGINVADEIRNRIQGEYNCRTLMPNIKKNIDATLVSSGYRPDSALNPSDIKELAKLLHSDEIIDGTVSRTANGYHVIARFFLSRDVALSQPLGTFDSKDFGDIAKKVVDEYDKGRKQIPDNQACENGIRENSPAKAIAAARKGLTTYPKSTLLRLCMASAYYAMRQTADSTGPWKDSVIANTKAVLDLDNSSRIAFQLLYEAYKAKGSSDDALKTLVAWMGAEPGNATLQDQVIAELVNSGKADIAVPIAKKLMQDNQGDPTMAKTYWLVLRAAKNYKESVPAGVAYVALDTAQADSSYFLRQIQDLTIDSSFAKAAEFASQASAKFPKSTTFLTLKAQNERKAGQLQAAKATYERILALDPKAPLVAANLANIANELGDIEGAIKYLKADIAADTSNRERDAGLALSFGNKLYAAASASKKAEDFKKALPILQAADSLQSSNNSKFLIAVTAFQIIAASATELQAESQIAKPSAEQRAKTCEDFKYAQEILALVSPNMMGGGGRVDASTAATILQNVPQFQAFIDGNVTRSCSAPAAPGRKPTKG